MHIGKSGIKSISFIEKKYIRVSKRGIKATSSCPKIFFHAAPGCMNEI